MKRSPFIFLLALSSAGLLLLSSCAGSPRGWRREARKISSHPVAGAWEGTWRSEVNGHRGKLRCVVSEKPDGRFEFRYRATWAKVLCGGYTVLCDVARDEKNGNRTVTGERDLGRLFGGVFSHEGVITGDTFHARYSSRLDRGVMELRRPRPSGRDR